MVGRDVGLEMEPHWTSTCPSNCEAWWWVNDDLGMHDTFGQGTWYTTEGRMDRRVYKFILEILLWSTIQTYNVDPSRLVFQHDNDPKHTSKVVQEWLASQPFQLLQWSKQSPYLNPIEHLWTLLKQRLNKCTIPPRGIQGSWKCVCSMYPNLSEHGCMALYESMSRRIDIVLKSRGYWTDY